MTQLSLPYSGSLNITVPDGGPIDAAYKAAGWAPPAPASNFNPVYDLYGAPVRTDLFVGLNYGAHEANWAGNPAWDWAKGARPGQLTAGSNLCAVFWGQFVDANGTTNNGVRIQVRNIELWNAANPTAAWQRNSTINGIGGALFDYTNYSSNGQLGNIRQEPTGGWSFAYTSGHINHIWDGAWPRSLNVPSSSALWHIRAEIKLIADAAIDFSTIKIIGSNACDWYPNNTATAQVAAGIGQARMRFLTPNWQWFTYTGMGQDQLTANMPPAPTNS